jgi:DNA adenine methylase
MNQKKIKGRLLMKNKFLLALLEDFSLDKIDIISSDKINEGVKPAFGSPGGKFFVAGKLISMFPEHKRYVEAFIGGGSILFRKNKGQEEFINDKDSEIVSCFRFMQNITDPQIEALNKMDWKTSKETFNKLLGEYKESPTNKDPVYQFYRYVYIKAASDAGEMRSYDDRAEGEIMKLTTRLAKIKERLAGVTIENMDYKDFVNKYANESSFTFLDPPYPSAKMNWKWCPTQEEFESFTKQVPGKWMVTYEVCDGWKEAKYNRKILSQYNLAAPSSGHMTRKNELVVTNYPIQQNTSYLSTSCIDQEEIIEALESVSSIDFEHIKEIIGQSIGEASMCWDEIPKGVFDSTRASKILNNLLKLYASKRRGDNVKQSFEQLKQSFCSCMKKMIESGITNFKPEKLSPFALELFDKFTEYKYIATQLDGNKQAFNSMKELKNSKIDFSEYHLDIKMKEAEKKFGSFAIYHQWWKGKNLESIDSFIIATDQNMDFFFNRNPIEEGFKEAVFYIKPSKYEVIKVNESTTFVAPLSNLNITSMPSWMKVIDIGKISILESTELEKTIEFLGDKLKGIFIAKRATENSDFWTIQEESQHSHDKCMECSDLPKYEVKWAEGMGHAWFCESHFKSWSDIHKGDIDYVKEVKDGRASDKFEDNTNPNIKDTILGK